MWAKRTEYCRAKHSSIPGAPNYQIAQLRHSLQTLKIIRPPFPWQGTVGWALGRVSAHKRSMCRVSEANRTLPQTSVQQTLHQISYSFRCKQHANCRGKITPTAVVYIVHTLYIHVWILPLSAKLVHIELLLTHKLATVNLWLLIAAYEQSLICYRANIHTFLAHTAANIC